ncbi:ABC transporter ATP-binding protein/permease [Patescibacteria group bacterium]|nr:ABC transporter ATP-binding protein/permease [Patescibacteria group bacterium]
MPEIKIKDIIKEFWKYAKPYKWFLLIFFVVIIANSIIAVVTPLFYKDLFNTVATNSVASDDVVASLIKIVIIILFLNGGSWLLFRLGGTIDAYTSTRIRAEMDEGVFERLQYHSYKFFTDNFAGSLMRRVKRFSQAYDTLSMVIFWNLLSLVVVITGFLLVLFNRNIWLGAVMFVAMIAIVAANVLFSIWKLKYDEDRAQKDTKASGVLVDSITNNANVKLFSGRIHEQKLFTTVREELAKAELISWLLAEGSFTIQALFMVLVEFSVMYVAIIFWQKGILTVGDFALIQAYLIGLFQRLWNIGRGMRKIYEAFADAKETVEILHQPYGVKDKPIAKRIKVNKGKIDFVKVDFNYNKTRKTLENFNININPGERVALVGPSGAGKSTAVKLLLRFHDVDAGKILIDGQNIADVTQDSLRESIGFVPQDPILFHRSLMENIRYGNRKASDKQVMEAAKLAHCHEFIQGLPEGYKTFVGERGIKLSGGERQRVAIARAILKNAPILILDEATSSLDSESEAMIQDALKTLMKNKTVIVIAHRLSTIMQMDRILVMQDGEVVDQGTHADLLDRRGLYKKLWSIQAGSFT